MYLPRHYKQDKKKSTNYPLIIFFILGFILVGSLIYKWKEITSYFSANSIQKISKLEESIIVSLEKKTFPKNLISEYKSLAGLYYDTMPTDSTANYLVAKSYYYQLFNRIKFNSSEIHELISFERKKSYLEYFQVEEDIEAMYRIALRANAFNPNFQEAEPNKLLIYLYELIANRKRPMVLLGELSLLDSTKLSKDTQKTFLWMNIINSALSGNIESLENYLSINESIGENKIDIQPRNVSFLKGVTFYHNNDYIKSLNFLRESKLGYDLITIEATKFEAMIFFKQNLHDKAISLLENIYEETGSQDKKIISLLKQILESKPGLKTKIKMEQ
ncbi:MAG: hypothetical protein IPL26_25480 [Leptospiraceae bacterium]|nr:hypothetical protein [Leptospiraceae bacterium]